MVAIYDESGIQIAYPENWELSKEESPDAKLQITITSPATAFWTLAFYPELRDLQQMVDQVIEALRSDYPDLEEKPIEEMIAGELFIGNDVNFICLDLTNTARIRVCHQGASTLLLYYQAEDTEFSESEAIFQAMNESLLRGIEVPSGEQP